MTDREKHRHGRPRGAWPRPPTDRGDRPVPRGRRARKPEPPASASQQGEHRIKP